MEYKFRGKPFNDVDFDEINVHIKKDEFVYGNLIQDGNTSYIVNGIVECTEDYLQLEQWIRVRPETVGQFTGLLDKNGKEIYCGDVVMFENSKHTVEYEKEYACYMLRLSGHYRTTFFDYDSEHLEIIGTIHDNEVK